MYLFTAIASTVYAVFLSTEEGKRWADANTTLAVVLGVGGVLAALRGVLDGRAWARVARMFACAGAPLVVRGVWRRVQGE